ncbi:MAG TPA: tandem-95 repeat protein [Gammaproteobacteria bacterium]|nr:tandem-95 repeat protein [Gammaproteobacteria bacterium]
MPRKKSLTADSLLPSALCLVLLAGCSPGDDTNKAPQAGDDHFQIKNGETRNFLSTDLLSNDSDPDGDTLKLVSVTTPTHGILTRLPSGGYRYVNDGSNSSNDSFSYQVEDSNGGRASATVTLEITPGPTANDDSQQTDEDTPVIIDVAANDTTVNNGSVTISSNDGSGITITSGPGNGTAEVISGEVQYTPDANFYGSDSFTYTIKDSSGIPSNPATVTIAVNPVNDAPQANDDNQSTPEDAPVSIDVLANDTDADGDIDANTISIVTPPTNGSAVVSDGKVIYTPLSNYSGTDSFRYTIRDQSSVPSNIATVTVTVTGTNDAPVAVDDSTSTGKNTPIDINILDNDSDPDGNDTIDTVTVTQQPNSGTAMVKADKSIRYEPAANYTGTVTFRYQLKDDMGQPSNIATVTITIANDAPVATGSCSATRQENNLTGVLGADDPNPNETLTFALGANGSAGSGPLTTANGGTVIITNNSTGAYTYTPKSNKGGRGRDTFTYQVTDGSGAISSATETVIVDLKIMPLGDSITSGETDVGNGGVPATGQRSGYRQPLQSKLTSYGYRFDFVGSLDHGCNLGYDYDAEGWPGYTAAQIAGIDPAPPINTCTGSTSFISIQDELDKNPADIILLHIGTNDIATTGIGDIEAILDNIQQWEDSPNGNPVTVVLARIIDQWHWKSGDGHPNNVVNSAVSQLNNQIDTLVAGRPNDDIIVVDMQGALNYPDDLGDRSRTDWHYWLHPETTGYNKMADVWLYPLIHQGTNRVTDGATGILMDKCN